MSMSGLRAAPALAAIWSAPILPDPQLIAQPVEPWPRSRNRPAAPGPCYLTSCRMTRSGSHVTTCGQIVTMAMATTIIMKNGSETRAI